MFEERKFKSLSDLLDYYEGQGFGVDKIEEMVIADGHGIEFDKIQIVAQARLTAGQMKALFEVAENDSVFTKEMLEKIVETAIDNELNSEEIESFATRIGRGDTIQDALEHCCGAASMSLLDNEEIDPFIADPDDYDDR